MSWWKVILVTAGDACPILGKLVGSVITHPVTSLKDTQPNIFLTKQIIFISQWVYAESLAWLAKEHVDKTVPN